MNNKKRLVVDYSQLSPEQRRMAARVYPDGFRRHIMKIPKSDGSSYNAFTLDTGDVLYLVKVSDEYLKSPDEIIEHVEQFEPDDTDIDH